MTLIGCGSALGKTIPPYCIFKVWPNRYFAWARGLDDDAAFNQPDTGFSNGDIMLDWLRHSMQTIESAMAKALYHSNYCIFAQLREAWFA